MQIFLSHSGKQKPLIREIKKYLPEHLGAWIDEEKLIFGDHISNSIESTIKTETDYLVLFIDDHAVESPWVLKEMKWAMEAEIAHNRTILLPIVIDANAFNKIDSDEIRNRKYLHLKDFQDISVRSLSESITSELFALVCRDIERLRNSTSKTSLRTLADADAIIRDQAGLVQKIVFPYRKSNPISKEKLLEMVNMHSDSPISENEFEIIFTSIIQRNLVPGLSYDGFEIFLIEEHASWKANVHHKNKEKIGRKAASFVQNGMKIFIDAGSTTEEIVQVLCKKIENRAITNIAIGTTSVNIADMISDCCVRMGFDDEFSAVRLYIPGGQIRPSTQAIVPAFASELRQINLLAEAVGGFDACFVGVNAVDLESGFTTHQDAEAHNKMDILAASMARYIVGDSSKVGLTLECHFAGLGDDLKFVVDDDPENQQLQSIVNSHASKVILA